MNALWNTSPRTIEEAITAVEAVKCWEAIYNQPCPFEMSIVLTNDLMLDMMRRIHHLERRDV